MIAPMIPIIGSHFVPKTSSKERFGFFTTGCTARAGAAAAPVCAEACESGLDKDKAGAGGRGCGVDVLAREGAGVIAGRGATTGGGGGGTGFCSAGGTPEAGATPVIGCADAGGGGAATV